MPKQSKLRWFINWLISSVLAKIIVGATLAVFAFSTTVINHDELAICTRFGRNVDAPLAPGLHFYFPFINEIRCYPTTIQFLLITDKSVRPDVTFEELFFDEGVTVTTSDGVETKVVLEVVYQIQKSQETVNAFVESFGRIESQDGTEKIEKLIADTTRGLTRQLLSNAELLEIEGNVLQYSSCIKAAANGEQLASRPNEKYDFDLGLKFQAPSLSSLGIAIKRLGYRLKPNAEFLDTRNRSAATLEQERNRIAQIEARKTADLAEVAADEEVLARKAELAKVRKVIFDNSPNGDIES